MEDAPFEPNRSEQTKTWAIGLAILLALLWWLWPEAEIKHPPGVIVPNPPIQSATTATEPWQWGEYQFVGRAHLELYARVLSKERYSWGRETALARYDLALGWGPMSDSRVLDKLSISQSNRWYHWRWHGSPPLSQKDIIANSSNFHIVPANEKVLKAMKLIKKGHVIYLEGQLVNIQSSDGWRWNSSLSRTDSGNGACELMWVESLEITDVGLNPAEQ